MNDFGPCYKCGAVSVVRVNDTGACKDHIDDVMREVFLPAREAFRRLTMPPIEAEIRRRLAEGESHE